MGLVVRREGAVKIPIAISSVLALKTLIMKVGGSLENKLTSKQKKPSKILLTYKIKNLFLAPVTCPSRFILF